MAINWEMGVTDPLKGVNTGLASLGQTLLQQKQLEQQQAQAAQQSRLSDLQLQSGQMDLQKKQLAAKNLADLQALQQSQKGRTVPVTSQVPNPDFQAGVGTMKDPNPAAALPPTLPQTTQQPMDERAKALETQNFLKERGMFDQLKELSTATNLTDKIDEKQRVAMAHVQSYGTMAYMQAINSGADEKTASKAAAQAAIAQAKAMNLPTDGMEQAQYKGNVSFMKAPDGGFMYTSLDPATGKLEIKHIAPVKDTEGLLDKRLAATATENEKNRAAADKRTERLLAAGLGPRGGKTALSINGVSAEDAALLSQAVAEGRANGDHINSRTAPVYAQMLRANPNLDLTSSAANAGALKKVESQRSMVSAFEKTASANFDLVERLYDKNPQGTVMLLNKLKTNINTNITGDPDTVMLGRALKTALMEYAKVVTGQTGGAAVSDSARREVESLLSQSDKPEAFHGSIANHRLEMKNRMSGFQETVNELKGGRGGNVRQPVAGKQSGRFTVEEVK